VGVGLCSADEQLAERQRHGQQDELDRAFNGFASQPGEVMCFERGSLSIGSVTPPDTCRGWVGVKKCLRTGAAAVLGLPQITWT
jgi:hypothetical protein